MKNLIRPNKIIVLVNVFLIMFIFLASTCVADIPKYFIHNPVVPNVKSFAQSGIAETSLYTGAFTYNYPIVVPKGRNNVQPSISLTYVSHLSKNTQGTTGSGWQLITEYIQRNTNYTFNNEKDDEYVLHFQGNEYKLVHDTVKNQYHTEIENDFFIIKLNSSFNSNKEYWVLVLPEGTRYLFGYSNNSEHVSNLYNYTWRWNLEKINDTYGNTIYYSYLKDPYANDIGASYLENIKYNNKNNSINFYYESVDRPDVLTQYIDGNKLRVSRRLKNIYIKFKDELINRYELKYNTISTKSFISNITLYGADNISILTPVKFYYENINKGWTEEANWNLPLGYYLTDDEGWDNGVRLIDLNGDGLVDLHKYKETQCSGDCRDTDINTGSGWIDNSSFDAPLSKYISEYNQSGTFIDGGFRYADVNGDSLIDLIIYKENGNRETRLNNGRGWDEDSNWEPPLGWYFVNEEGLNEEGIQLEDINGDGLPDFIKNKNLGTREAKINTGSGWEEDESWEPPTNAYFTESTRIVELNGDGLIDLIRYEEGGVRDAWINTGEGWVQSDEWEPPLWTYFVDNNGQDYGVRTIDVNGDGLTDLIKHKDGGCGSGGCTWAYINTGSGWEEDESWEPPLNMYFVDDDGENEGVRFADVNGDGLVDIVKYKESCGTNCRETHINNAYNGFLLNKIKTEFGGEIYINYTTSTSLDNFGGDSISDLPFNINVVTSVVKKNNILNPKLIEITKFNFSGGFFKSKDKEFRGFNSVEKKKIGVGYFKQNFHQDNSRKGKEYLTEYYDSNNKLIQKSENKWTSEDLGGYYKVNLIKISEKVYEGSSNSKTKNITYSYDSFGNIVSINHYGDDGKNGDEFYEYFEYLNNSVKWIVNKPKIHKIYASDNATKLRETRYRYDNQSYGIVPIKGAVTREEKWLSGGSNSTKLFDYDTYGNLIKSVDANGNKIQYVYGIRDNTFTYPDRVINPKNHTTNYYYDKRGKVVSIIDSNKINTSFQYDFFGRKTKEIQPYNNLTHPTTEIEYDFDGIAPEKVIIKMLSTSSDTFDTYVYYDGLGNEIQVKTEAEDSKQVVRNKYYGKDQKLEFESNPYLIAFSENYTIPNTTVKGINYTYDGLERIKKIKNPDGTIKTFNYSIRNITVYDENGNKKQEIFDAYGNKIKIYEFNGNEAYRTEYKYTLLGNLILINDSQSNLINFTYDTLGRKTKLIDPDLGTWTYEYDANSNLIKQTDANGKIITLQYDSLNRVTKKNTTGISITYTYDTVKNGTLSKITTALGDKTFTYDNRYRVKSIKDQRFGLTFSNNFTYDSADRITKKILSDGTIITYNYTDEGSIESISNALKQITYNELNLPKRRQYISGIDTNFTYKTDNLRLSAIKTSNIQNFKYNYDNIGNILKINDTINSRIQSMGYDDLDRLTSAKMTNTSGALYSFNYTYNSIGNILNINSMNNDLAYSYSNPVHAPESITVQ